MKQKISLDWGAIQGRLEVINIMMVHFVLLGLARGTGEVVEGQGKDSVEKEKSPCLVFCHLEFIRSTSSPDLHLTQLAAVSTDHHPPVFLPVAPPVLAEYLEDYKLSGDLMQALTLTRDLEDRNTFLFRPTVLVKKFPRLVCVPEKEALSSFLKFLEDLGPNIILVVKLNPNIDAGI